MTLLPRFRLNHQSAYQGAVAVFLVSLSLWAGNTLAAAPHAAIAVLAVAEQAPAKPPIVVAPDVTPLIGLLCSALLTLPAILKCATATLASFKDLMATLTVFVATCRGRAVPVDTSRGRTSPPSSADTPPPAVQPSVRDNHEIRIFEILDHIQKNRSAFARQALIGPLAFSPRSQPSVPNRGDRRPPRFPPPHLPSSHPRCLMSSTNPHLGDCFAVLPTLADQSIDLILTDPPYGTTACRWDKLPDLARLWAEWRRVLAPGGAVVCTACQPFTTAIINGNPRWFRYSLVWAKGRTTGFLDANRKPLRAHEDVLVFAPKATAYNPQFTVGTPYTVKHKRRAIETLGDKAVLRRDWTTVNSGRRYPTTILDIPDPSRRGKIHPTQKPVALFEWLLFDLQQPGRRRPRPVHGIGHDGPGLPASRSPVRGDRAGSGFTTPRLAGAWPRLKRSGPR